MCETEYYNKTYPSGERALVEQIKPCRHRCFESPSWSLKDRIPTPYYSEHKLSPAEKEHRRERRSSERGRYYADDKDYSVRRSSSLRGSRPIDIPKPRRSSTMYEDDRYYREPKRESRHRSDRPVIVENSSRDHGHRSSRRESATVPLGWEALYYGSPSRREEKYKDRNSYMEPSRSGTYRRHSESPTEVHDRHRERRSDGHRSRRDKAIVVPDGPIPSTAADILYGSSPIGSYGSSYNSHRSGDYSRISTPAQSPPKSPGIKAVHWGDDPRAAQNARISSRPKLSRSATISGAGTGKHMAGEVKGILKTSSAMAPSGATMDEAGSAPAVQPLSRDTEDQLHKSVERLGVDSRETSPQRRVKRERAADYLEGLDGMGDRLRSRIAPKSRRASFIDMSPRPWGEKASTSRRRTGERFYTDYSPDYAY